MAGSRNSLSTELSDRVAAFFSPRLVHGRRVCVALSGGRDSVALLQVLAEIRGRLPCELSALHVHHGLSANADAWADFCVDLCRRLDVRLHLARVTVADRAGEGPEAAARRARYTAFARCAADWLALAHHRDDQAETLLLNLLRGAGADGLAAMPEERPLTSGLRLVRPLLTEPRSVIDGWLRRRDLRWVEDESNADDGLRRNFLRNQVLPLLATVFPQPAAAIARSAALLAESAALAAEVAAADAEGMVDDAGALGLAGLAALPPARQASLLRHQLRERGWRMPDARYLAEILRQLANASADAAPLFRMDGGDLRVHRGRLHFCRAAAPSPAVQHWQGESALPWAGGVLRFAPTIGTGLSLHRLQAATVSVGPRRGGEVLRTHPRRPCRSLKKLLQEAGVPPWQRMLLPVLRCGDEVAWVAGVGIAAGFAAEPGEAAVLPIWETREASRRD